MSTPLFVIADQRSGTNLLRRSLASTGQLCDLNEIFHPQGGIYWLFREQQFRPAMESAPPTADHQIEWFESFLGNCLPPEFPFSILDVKYNSSHVLNEFSRSPIDTPLFVKWLIQKQYPVIHLVRKNSLESYVSLLVGLHTNNWVVDVATPQPAPIRLKLDVAETIFQVAKRQRQIKQFRQLLQPANCLEVSYESLIDPTGEFSRFCLNQICQFVGLSKSLDVQVTTQKTGRPLRDVVENYDQEILPALIEQGMGEIVDFEPETRSIRFAPTVVFPRSDRPAIRIRPQPVLKNAAARISRKRAKSRPVFVISPRAGGAELFRRTFATHIESCDLGQIFLPAKNSYWSYRAQQLAVRPELSLPNLTNQLEIFESFLDHRLSHDKPFTLIDVSYDFVHSINETWYAPGSRPMLLAWLLEQKCAVVHLVNHNFCESGSHRIDTKSDLTEQVQGAASGRGLTIDQSPIARHRQFKWQKTESDVMRAWLAPTNLLEIPVAWLIAPDYKFPPEVIQKVAEFVGIDVPLEVERQPLAGGISRFAS